jgi:hypothetical protein
MSGKGMGSSRGGQQAAGVGHHHAGQHPVANCSGTNRKGLLQCRSDGMGEAVNGVEH